MNRDPDTYVVIIKNLGSYVLCTRKVFLSKREAENYASICSPSREAIVVPGDFRNLRFEDGTMADQVGYLIDSAIAICNDCGDKAHVLAHETSRKLYRADVHPYKQTCNICGTTMVDGQDAGWCELYSSHRQKATVREMKTPTQAIKPTRYSFVGTEHDTDIDELMGR